jgi:heme-degrading monooxygenase HmoA
VIARIWKGAVRREDGDAYARYMQATGIAEYARTPGNRAALMLRRDVGDRCEFVMVTLWDSMAAVTAFAGPEPERAVFYPQDDRYLVERDLTMAHYEVDTAVLDPALQAAEPPGGPAGAPEAPA